MTAVDDTPTAPAAEQDTTSIPGPAGQHAAAAVLSAVALLVALLLIASSGLSLRWIAALVVAGAVYAFRRFTK